MTKQFQNDDFTKLFKYMEQHFKVIEGEISDVRSEVGRVKDTLDHVVGELDNKREEDDIKAAQINSIDDVLGDHETRIAELEQATV